MQKNNDDILYSASDIVNFLECEHLTALDRINLNTPLPKTPVSIEGTQLIQDKGYAHENAFANILKQRYGRVVDVSEKNSDIELMEQSTLAAIRSGADIICQATLRNGPLLGHADFLRRVPSASRLGDYSYEVIDTKLARKAKAKFIIQLAFYSSLVANIQGCDPRMMYVVYGDKKEGAFHYADYRHYFDTVLNRFLICVQGQQAETYPSPCAHCTLCTWRELCEEQRSRDDHLCQVANITQVQIKKLKAANITTLETLGKCSPGFKVAKMAPATLERLISQASLQLLGRQSGKRQVEILPGKVANEVLAVFLFRRQVTSFLTWKVIRWRKAAWSTFSGCTISEIKSLYSKTFGLIRAVKKNGPLSSLSILSLHTWL